VFKPNRARKSLPLVSQRAKPLQKAKDRIALRPARRLILVDLRLLPRLPWTASRYM